MNMRLNLIGALAMVIAPMAHADFVISYNSGGGAIQCSPSGAPDTGTTCFTAQTNIGTVANPILIQNLSGNSNSPGTSSLSRQAGSVFDIETGASGATVTIWLAAQNFAMPIAPPALAIQDVSSLTLIPTQGTGTVALQSCIDQNNGTAPPNGTYCGAAGDLKINSSLGYTDTTSHSVDVTGFTTSLSAPFSLSQMVTLTLGANTILEVQTRQVLTPVPEPFSIALLGGVILLTTRSIRRKRNQIS